MFHRVKTLPLGLHSMCKDCRSEYNHSIRHKINATRMRSRHRQGISINYVSRLPRLTLEERIQHRRFNRKKYKTRKRNGGILSIKTIQLVYEDNIKRYGTLTCYLCLSPIEFRMDNLEHKTPLSRGGTNEYSNLGVSCWRCNNKKRTRTEAEFRKEMSHGMVS